MYLLVACIFKMKEINAIHHIHYINWQRESAWQNSSYIHENMCQQMEGEGGHKEIFSTR